MKNIQQKLQAYLEQNVQALVSKTISSAADYELDIEAHPENVRAAIANFYTLEDESQTCSISIRVKAVVDDVLHCSVTETDSDGYSFEFLEQIAA